MKRMVFQVTILHCKAILGREQPGRGGGNKTVGISLHIPPPIYPSPPSPTPSTLPRIFLTTFLTRSPMPC